MADNKDWTKTDIGKKPEVLVTFAGYKLKLESSQKWAAAMAAAMPSKSGVGTAFAVRGPAKSGDKFDVDGLAEALAPSFTGDDSTRIHVVTHSSGYAFSDKLLALLLKNKDAVSAERIFYYNVDGGDDDLAGVIAKNTKQRSLFCKAFAVSGHTTAKSRNFGDMKNLGEVFKKAGLGSFVDLDFGKIMGKDADKWPPDGNVLHMALINPAKPLWYVPGKDDAEKAAMAKQFPSFYGGDLNVTYASCTKSTVNVEYIVK